MSRVSPTTLDFALLGLLAERPLSGYDLILQFTQTPLIRFSPSPGSVYPALKRLKKWNLIKGKTDRSQPLRPREVYRPTQVGARRLREWLFKPITRDDVATRPDDLTLRFALMQPVEAVKDVTAFLQDYRRAMLNYQNELTRLHDERGQAMGRNWRLSLELGIRRYAQNAEWADDAITAIRRSAGTAIPRRKRRTRRSPTNDGIRRTTRASRLK